MFGILISLKSYLTSATDPHHHVCGFFHLTLWWKYINIFPAIFLLHILWQSSVPWPPSEHNKDTLRYGVFTSCSLHINGACNCWTGNSRISKMEAQWIFCVNFLFFLVSGIVKRTYFKRSWKHIYYIFRVKNYSEVQLFFVEVWWHGEGGGGSLSLWGGGFMPSGYRWDTNSFLFLYFGMECQKNFFIPELTAQKRTCRCVRTARGPKKASGKSSQTILLSPSQKGPEDGKMRLHMCCCSSFGICSNWRSKSNNTGKSSPPRRRVSCTASGQGYISILNVFQENW